MVQTWGGEKRIERPWIFLVYHFKQNLHIFFQENACENVVCEMVAILLRGVN